MFERLKRAMVESYVGAVALGYLLAQVLLHFVNIFASPVAGLVSRKQYAELIPRTAASAGLSLQDALPELVRFLVLLVVWFVLLRWLYFKPLSKDPSQSALNPEQGGQMPANQ